MRRDLLDRHFQCPGGVDCGPGPVCATIFCDCPECVDAPACQNVTTKRSAAATLVNRQFGCPLVWNAILALNLLSSFVIFQSVRMLRSVKMTRINNEIQQLHWPTVNLTAPLMWTAVPVLSAHWSYATIQDVRRLRSAKRARTESEVRRQMSSTQSVRYVS